MSQHTDARPATIAVENIGGIDECEIEFSPGTTVLTGENATNRTSLLTAISGVFGGTTTTLKSDTDEGVVRLEYDGETYTRRYHRQSDGTVRTSGEPYTDESELVDLFACLLESNPARQVVERNGDLREMLMEPVDTEQIQQRIDEFERERERVRSRLEEIEAERNRLPSVESQRTSLEAKLDSVTQEIETLRERVADHDVDVDGVEEVETLLGELDSRRQSLAQTRDEIETQESTLDALRDERDAVAKELDELNAPTSDRERLEQEIADLRDRESELRDSINDLSAIVEFSEGFLDSTETVVDEIQGGQDVTAELDPKSTTVTCWTCGSRVERQDIDAQLDELRNVIEEKRAKRQELQDRIDDLRDQLDDVRSTETRRTDLRDQLDDIERQIQHRERRLETLEENSTSLHEAISDLEDQIAETEALRESKLGDQYERLSELEYERGQIEQELSDVETEIQRLESLETERDQLQSQQMELRDELGSLRTRVEELERDAVRAFNEHMAELLALLEYQNIERVWIERKVSGDDADGRFQLHVVRSADEGAVYEDTVEHLSESEREVIGLVVALAGYLVHDVHETVPVMLLDSLEAIDATRIARLLDYFADFATYLIVALLEEDASRIDASHTRVSAERI